MAVLVDSFACFSSLQLFVGLSFPYEGPAPLEAIANGCAFLNPKFNLPKSSKNTDFFKGKPTLREVRGGGFSITLLPSSPGNTQAVPNLPWGAAPAPAQIMSPLCSWPLSILTPRCTLVNRTSGRWTSRTVPRWRRPFTPFSARRWSSNTLMFCTLSSVEKNDPGQVFQ